MSDSILEKYRLHVRPEPESVSTDEGLDDLGTFGFLRGSRDRALMLEFRFSDGSIVALGYSWLEQVAFNPSEGITLQFGRRTVKITGQNLDRAFLRNLQLVNGILRHRIPWLRESDHAEIMEASPEAVLIENITIEE